MKKVAKKKNNQIKFAKNLTSFLVPIDTVKLWESNPRYNDAAVPKLAKVFQSNGVRSPIIAWNKNRTIYKGNTSFKALQALGCKQVPVIFQEFPSEAAAKAYGIADNKSSEYSDWDEDVLLDLMESGEISQPVTGFKESEVARMIKKRDEDIITNIQTYNLPSLKLMYHPEIKDELFKYIEKTLLKKFGDKVVIK